MKSKNVTPCADVEALIQTRPTENKDFICRDVSIKKKFGKIRADRNARIMCGGYHADGNARTMCGGLYEKGFSA